MGAVFKKELRGYFTGFTGYILLAVMLVMMGYFTNSYCLVYQLSVFEYVYGYSVLAFIFVIPIITMRMFAEEKKQGTDRLLYSLPLKMSEIIIGKYLAALVVLGIPCIVSSLYPIILSKFGNINFKLAYTSLICFFLLGAALTAVCMFISVIAENHIIAAIFSFIFIIINYFLSGINDKIPSTLFASTVALVVIIIVLGILVWLFTKNSILSSFIAIFFLILLITIGFIKSELIQGLFPKVLEKIGLFDQYYIIISGALDISTIFLYISTITLFCFLSVQVLERRRWA